MNILVAEDDQHLAESICQILHDAGYRTEMALDGGTALRYAQSGMYDLPLLDVMMPGMDGIAIARQLRAEGNAIPILMLTARDSTEDKVRGLDSGADDYMTKPFEALELLARIRALSRRQGDVVIDEESFGDLTLSLESHDLSTPTRNVHLSQKEFQVMRLLLTNTGRIVSKQELLTRVWGTSGEASENSAEAYVSFLRKKLAHINSRVRIATLRMLGYRLEMVES